MVSILGALDVHNLPDVSLYTNDESLHRRRKHRRRDKFEKKVTFNTTKKIGLNCQLLVSLEMKGYSVIYKELASIIIRL